MVRPWLLLLAALVAAASLAAPALGGEVDVVQIDTGYVAGVRDAESNVRAWRGVPFGESTAGENRFAAPVPKRPWQGLLNTTTFGPGCISSRHNADVPAVTSEDCLNLNVYAPLKATTGPGAKPLPVVVWIYGGSFAEGSNQGPFGMYDASYLAANYDVVYVSVNYRLGVFGFMVTPELSGNYGLQDQQLALQWVRRNVAAFGGDPTRVTLQGESAGAMSIGLHLISPASRGLFSRAILESNPLGLRYEANENAQLYGLTACSDLGCADSGGASCNVSCLRQANTTEVVAAWQASAGSVIDYILANWGHWLDGFLDYKPTVDGQLVPANVVDALEAGLLAPGVAVLLGSNTNEAETFLMGGGDPLPMWAFDIAVEAVFGGENAAKVLAYYVPANGYNFTDARLALSQVLTHFWFRCPTEKIVSAAAAAGQPSFVYRYDHVFSASGLWSAFGLPSVCGELVCHAGELPFVFHFTDIDTPVYNASMTPAEVQLSSTMNAYWTNFAKTGSPNVQGLPPTWPAWNNATRLNIVLDETTALENTQYLCGTLWDSIGYEY